MYRLWRLLLRALYPEDGGDPRCFVASRLTDRTVDLCSAVAEHFDLESDAFTSGRSGHLYDVSSKRVDGISQTVVRVITPAADTLDCGAAMDGVDGISLHSMVPRIFGVLVTGH